MSDSGIDDTREPTAESPVGVKGRVYRHNPYACCCIIPTTTDHQQRQCQQQRQSTFQPHSTTLYSYDYDNSSRPDRHNDLQIPPFPPPSRDDTAAAGTLHGSDLSSVVSFIEYPQDEFVLPKQEEGLPRRDKMARIFIGQLPYDVTDMQLQWLCFTFGSGAAVYEPERIIKKGHGPTGCIHALCSMDSTEALFNGLDKRLLVDDTGVWYAQNEVELDALSSYCKRMKAEPKYRPKERRPYDLVSAQLATSTYKPRKNSRHARRRRCKSADTNDVTGMPLTAISAASPIAAGQEQPTNNQQLSSTTGFPDEKHHHHEDDLATCRPPDGYSDLVGALYDFLSSNSEVRGGCGSSTGTPRSLGYTESATPSVVPSGSRKVVGGNGRGGPLDDPYSFSLRRLFKEERLHALELPNPPDLNELFREGDQSASNPAKKNL